MHPAWLVKTILIAFFILMPAPISSHNLGKAAHKSGIPLTDKTQIDECPKKEENK